jgi:hypothetical protein
MRTFLPASVSARATEALGNQKRGSHYRVTDEEMYRVIDPKEAIAVVVPALISKQAALQRDGILGKSRKSV